MRLILVTVGFEEKLPLRGLLKVGLSAGDVVALVYSRSGGEFEVRKVEKAVGVIKEIIGKAGVSVVDVEVSGSNFYGDVAKILWFLREQKASEVVAVLAGGMRLVAFEVLNALLMLHRHSGCTGCSVLLMREDGLYDVILPVELFYVTVSKAELAVLRALRNEGALKRRQLIEVVSREVGVSASAVYKSLKSLAKKKLVVVEDETVKPTEMSRLLLLLYEG
ncbi:MAG: CRISPR-associated CARF protein Csa3 [Desulfurococcaceae archaeon]